MVWSRGSARPESTGRGFWKLAGLVGSIAFGLGLLGIIAGAVGAGFASGGSCGYRYTGHPCPDSTAPWFNAIWIALGIMIAGLILAIVAGIRSSATE
jgi:hypothetical protein